MSVTDKDYIKRQTELVAKGLKKFMDEDVFEKLFDKSNDTLQPKQNETLDDMSSDNDK